MEEGRRGLSVEVEQSLGRTEGDLHSLQRRQRRALLQEHVVEASLLHPLAHLRGSSRRLGNQATFAKNEEERRTKKNEERTRHRLGSSKQTAMGTRRLGCLNGLCHGDSVNKKIISLRRQAEANSWHRIGERGKTNMTVAVYLANCSYWWALAGMFRATTV